ncbi:ABC transporter, permease protein [Syntrophomonas zehnderi OL-4]|uniref:ABC transporter, permease protein n=1 Tax=Syntrophomonas zehnderi OL-4 TaxID=690567 RepID=A0A0E4C823_9FIRM|nr:iron ABC transporter permease [Syntrophomonas zehnderi]CFX19317.1 ABC transporter, permease protein [Syntrophomonas zehnderi OL-4]
MVNDYAGYTAKKKLIILLLFGTTLIMGVYAISTGSSGLTMGKVVSTLLGQGDPAAKAVILNIRLPRILAGLLAGAGLSVAGCVMQNTLRNPLASPFTLGISQAAAFGAALAIVTLGAGKVQNSIADAVLINNPYLVTTSAFAWAMIATLVILLLAKFRGITPEAMVLAGVALGSLFGAGTTIVQYFAPDVQVAAVVFWTFGDLGRASWNEVIIMTVVVSLSIAYFLMRRWDYNALDSGEESALGLGVNVDRIRLGGMFIASLITAVLVSFLGIIGFIGLVGPHMMRRIIGGDHRYLIPASVLAGSLLLLISDTLARTIMAPVVLPVGAITAFMGAPLFLYLLARGYQKK